jgi:valyl-tRNA synthetase
MVDDLGDAARTLNADVHFRTDRAKLERVVSDIAFEKGVVGPAFRKKAQAFMAAVRAFPPADLEHPPKTIVVEGEEVAIPQGAFSPKFSYVEEGAAVDVVTVGDVIVAIHTSA